MSKREKIDPSQVARSALQHADLPDELVAEIGAIYRAFDGALEMTLEEWELGFMRDAWPATRCVPGLRWPRRGKRFIGNAKQKAFHCRPMSEVDCSER